MMQSTLQDVLQHLRMVWTAKESRDLTDSQLLKRFLLEQDEAAFAVLMQRHGPLVLGVCRRLTGDAHLAEDSFQGTFMVLAKRAGSIRKKSSVASWLYGVAQHIALRAKARASARHGRERQLTDMPDVRPLNDLTCQELQTALDAEIGRLPDKYRAPIVLCYLESKSYDEAARELRCPKMTLANRLNRGCELLRKRLTRRGITLPAGAIAGTLTAQLASAAVTARLTLDTAKAAMNVAGGVSMAAAGLSARAVVLAQEGMKVTVGVSAKVVAVVVIIGMTVGGVGMAGYAGWKEQDSSKPPQPKREVAQQPPPKNELAKKENPPHVDLFGDPLPKDALARLGTERFRHGREITAVAYADGGKVLVSSARVAYGVCIWDATTGKSLHRLTRPSHANSLAVSSDGKQIITDSLQIIDVATGKVIRSLDPPGGGSSLVRVAFSPDGETVAATGFGKEVSTIFLFDTSTGKWTRRIEAKAGQIRSLAFSPNGKMLVSAGSAVQLWNAESGKELRQVDAKNVLCLAFSPDSKLLATAGTGLHLWNPETGKVQHSLHGENEKDVTTTIAFSTDGESLASGGTSSKLHIWNVTNGSEIRHWKTDHVPTSSAFSPDGKVLATVGAAESSIRRWDTSTGKEINSGVSNTSEVQSLRFGVDAKTLMSIGKDGRFLEWDTDSGQTRDDQASPTLGKLAGISPTGWQWQAADLSPDGKLLALAAADKWNPVTFKLLDVASGKAIHELADPSYVPAVFKFSPDGKVVASGSESGVRVWDSTTGKELHHLKEPRFPKLRTAFSQQLAYSIDGKMLAAASMDKSIFVWDVATGKELCRVKGLDSVPFMVAFSPDGKKLAYADSIKVCLLSLTAGKELMRLGGQENLFCLALSPSGRVLAVGGLAGGRLEDDTPTDGTPVIRLWEVATGKPIREFKVPNGPVQGGVSSLAFAPDGMTLASGGADSTILLWDLTGHANGSKVVPPNVTLNMLDALWSNLEGEGINVDRTIWSLALSPQQSMPFLKDRMRPVQVVDDKKVASLIDALDSNSFAERQKAAQALENLGESAESAVRKHLAGTPSLEVRQRLQQFLANRDKDAIRKLRAIEVLELIGTAEARQLLETLSKGAPNPRVAEGAAGALARLSNRGL